MGVRLETVGWRLEVRSGNDGRDAKSSLALLRASGLEALVPGLQSPALFVHLYTITVRGQFLGGEAPFLEIYLTADDADDADGRGSGKGRRQAGRKRPSGGSPKRRPNQRFRRSRRYVQNER
jgi:hypothetical protein